LRHVATYGRLYTWYAVTDNRNVCPAGWHIPTDAEWTTLIDYLGGSTVGGGKLKETGTKHWWRPNTGATNESGFTALPGGKRNTDGSYSFIRLHGYWWSSEEYPTAGAFGRDMGYNYTWVLRNYGFTKRTGFSVRCIKD
jgi:uncharacterized protein (TIGR02145 family)